VDLFSTVLGATAAAELLAALLFALAFVRRPTDYEYGIAALLGVAGAQHAIGAWMASGATTTQMAFFFDRISALGLAAAIPLAVHFALVYRGGRASWISGAAMYGAGALLAAVNWIAPVTDFFPRAIPATFDADLPHRATWPGATAIATHGLSVAAATVVLVLVARAYLAGRRGALAVVVGATVLLATAINDGGVASGAFATGYLTDAGLAALIVGIATTPSARYAAAAHDLERRTKELRTRTNELRRSYEELRAAQEELVKKEQLAVVGELAAVIAHEVRNPLAIIANAVAGLRRPAISREDHEVLLAILDEETSRLNRLVTDLLRYARPVNIQRSHLALGDLLERALALANTGAKTIRMELQIEAHEGRLWGDANLLRQVFDNLIDNAVQAMGTGGTLTVRVRATTDEGADGLAVDIIDTGEGMDTQVRSRALDPFFTTRPSGTGLGLAIVDRIVDAHGGRLAIESRAGEGTTVTVFLPHGSPSEPPPGPRRARLGSSDANA
jgi:signal transduction histidine kinase